MYGKTFGIILISLILISLSGCASGEEMETADCEVAESTETVSEEQPGEETEAEREGEYTISAFSAKMYATTIVNVRDKPDIDGNKLGCLDSEQEVTVSGQCRETGWYQIIYKEQEAYVCNDYITNDPPAGTETVTEEQPEEETGTEMDGKPDYYSFKPAPEAKAERVFLKMDARGFPVYDFMTADEVAECTDYKLGVGLHESGDLFSFYERRLPNALPDFESGCMECFYLAKEMGYARVEAVDFETVEMYGIEDDHNLKLICVEKVTMQGCK